MEHQLAAQTTGSVVCMAGGDAAGRCLLARNQMPGRTVSGAGTASGWLSLGLSRGEIV